MNPKTCLFVSLLLTAPLCWGGAPLRVATSNVRTSAADGADAPKGNGWQARKDRLRQALQRTQAQLLGFQELSSVQASDIRSWFADTHELRTGPGGLGLLVDRRAFAIQDSGSGQLEGSDEWGDRFFQWARLAPRDGCGCVLAVNTHFSTEQASRLSNGRTLGRWLSEQTGPCGLLVMGDLNDVEGPVTAPLRASAGPDQAWDGAAPGKGTFNDFAGPPGGPLSADLKLDHILVRSPQLRLLGGAVDDQHPGQNASSDHYVLRAEVGLDLAALCPKSRPVQVEALLRRMTLEEKIGQLTQYSGNAEATGPVSMKKDLKVEIKKGRVGSMLNVLGTRYTREYQEAALQSRLKIPLLFGQDVIHGYKTTFPIPLAEAASWDLEAIERAARIAATEASASGIHWTFAPMVDIARDPRWGRVMEGAGEDTFLSSRIAAARVKGFQGRALGDTDAVMACAKHFAAYGAAIGGRDYNSVDMSERLLRETYLPPFKAALDAGAATFMNSFNDLNGIPATGNRHLQRDILKGEWGFSGFVVSDWGSIGEMISHGFAADGKAAALAALTAGSDMDMESGAYRDHLAGLVAQGQVSMDLVDDAVRRVLRKKAELGLFDDPFRFSDPRREQAALADPEHRQAARELAAKSIVLLKNEGGILPLSRSLKTIAFVGPLVKAVKDNHGFWSVTLPGVDYSKLVVSQWDGLKNKLGTGTRLLYAKGCDIEGEDKSGFAEAAAAARQADAVVLSVGERWDMSGEAKSRSSIRLPGVQEDLVKAVLAAGKPVVVLVNAGRPLVLGWTADHAPAILYTWWLGSEAGNAIADVLLGDTNPSAKLPMTFPRSEGQIPIYYNSFSTGRPAAGETATHYVSAYIDLPNSPRFPFGYGLSYTQFKYSGLKLDRKTLRAGETLRASLDVANIGPREGEEVVQLYLRDKVGSVVRPIKELKDFRKIRLRPGETRTVTFVIDREKLSFYNDRLEWAAEPGGFELMVGASSQDIRLRDDFQLLD